MAILNLRFLSLKIKYCFNEGSWQYEFKAADNYYTYYTFAEANGVITVNGQPMTYQGLGNVSSTGYVQSSAGSARMLYISADLLTEETNTVTFSRNGYVDMTLSVAGKTPRLAAPTLSVDTVASSQKTITVTISEDATEDWWSKVASLTTAGTKLTYGSSSTATISQLVANREERTLTITTSSNLSNYYTYQLVLAPSGYLPTSLSFKPA
ncbi:MULTISPECIES: DUF1533 domain-containing protein [unclassified Enterococcus]|uniref:DUF1533 domain-containing protein n=1 Tax=unclassified Enterococcus TaxID=2608891 RepID=UPI001553CAEE|nr:MULTISPECIES: DUF1533 domain-containing protein [unclassified Enterococcus]MBS7575966.1 DUF1533 domain-containing protein [Enterococcus sp. MMGLQ5-2]MBS7583199.1 DUF1533 domain-containing protein [Enterococcus sp. MMGLQ5-1]NPD11059.1 DUF1533 domain-containing protein [Enterococcus sp. MMGLQ5-1]NPD35802.1 DUF1533 domain-containing protein [Enterococcus sp. MMGLQ5-2]